MLDSATERRAVPLRQLLRTVGAFTWPWYLWPSRSSEKLLVEKLVNFYPIVMFSGEIFQFQKTERPLSEVPNTPQSGTLVY